MATAHVDRLLAAAHKRVASFDAIDRAHGSPTPRDLGLRQLLATVRIAMLTGLNRRDEIGWECVADGIVMLEDAEALLKKE